MFPRPIPARDRVTQTGPALSRLALRVLVPLVLAGSLAATPARAGMFDSALQLSVALPPGSGTNGVAVGDMNGDGNPDLVVSNQSANTVSVLLGTGHATFGPRLDQAVGAAPRLPVLGDLNGDGKLDAVVPTVNSGVISVLLGNGAGGFSSRVDLPQTSSANVALADMNNDGVLDLVSTNFSQNKVSVWIGNGLGGFASPLSVPAGSGPYGVAVGDVNSDGYDDVVVSAANVDSVSVLLGNGTGALATAVEYPAGHQPGYLALADLDNDGTLDLAVSDYQIDALHGGMFVLTGAGNGSFTVLGTQSIGLGATGITAADLDGDGVQDLIAASTSGSVSFLSLSSPNSQPVPVTGPAVVAVGDFDGNGVPDLAVSSNDRIAIILGTPSLGGFGPPATYTFTPSFSGSGQWFALASGDINGDGRPDLVGLDGIVSGIGVLFGDGSGGFPTRTNFATGAFPSGVACADLNGDGKADLVFANSGSNSVSVVLSNGTAAVGTRVDYPVTSALTVAVRDFNGDNKPDIAVTSTSPKLVILLLNQGAGTFAPSPTTLSTGSSPTAIAAADLDGNGTSDLVVLTLGSNTLSVWLGNGAGTFGARTDYATGSAPTSLAIGDVNQDGLPDILVGHSIDANSALFLGTGAGAFAPRVNVATGPVNSVLLADVNGDGRLDLIDAPSSGVVVALGDGAGGFGAASSTTTGFGGAVLARDFDGDGRPDLAIAAGLGVFQIQRALHAAQLSLTASVDPAPPGNPLILTAHATPASGPGPTPTGITRYFEKTTQIGAPTLAGGYSAALTVPASQGLHTFTLAYAGDNFYTRASLTRSVRVFASASAAPVLTSLKDVSGDQGHQIRLRFKPSGYDLAGGLGAITQYEVYRQIDPRLTAPQAAPAAARPALAPASVQLAGWDYVGAVPAHADTAYTIVVPTVADSNGSGIHRATFLVRAATPVASSFYDSPADSGYSVDNLPPVPPAALVAAYSGGATHLHWAANTESDFWYYRIHRGSAAAFVPGPGNLLASKPDTGYADAGPAGSWYKLAAIDRNGNVSGYAVMSPGGTASVDGGVLAPLSFDAPGPNPTATASTLRFVLPRAGYGTLRVYDVRGRIVRTLASGELEAGEHAVPWNLRDGPGAKVENGVYFVRLVTSGGTLQRRLVVIR